MYIFSCTQIDMCTCVVPRPKRSRRCRCKRCEILIDLNLFDRKTKVARQRFAATQQQPNTLPCNACVCVWVVMACACINTPVCSKICALHSSSTHTPIYTLYGIYVHIEYMSVSKMTCPCTRTYWRYSHRTQQNCFNRSWRAIYDLRLRFQRAWTHTAHIVFFKVLSVNISRGRRLCKLSVYRSLVRERVLLQSVDVSSSYIIILRIKTQRLRCRRRCNHNTWCL